MATAKARPTRLGLPFTHWSLRKLAAHLGNTPGRRMSIGRERLRQIQSERGISFQRTRTWKESNDPDFDAKLDRIDEVLTRSHSGVLPSTSSDHCPSARTTASAGHRVATRIDYRRPTGAPTASATSTAATPSWTIGCGA
ncbi:hypothetical protein BC739_001499 [Kutzneria viridogrisea]|uniref:Uncharacterized protein n=1 Tax=Kutzneria viridogrisea TaxID=47990 RepID=A0ABR6BBQ6_9PSEU|nr:hypothetical protein [Kutzneria viridogrisea]